MQVPYSERNIKYAKGESLATSIKSLIKHCSESTQTFFNMHDLSIHLKFPRRRFYDVINVLSAIGFCDRIEPGSMIWKGKKSVQDTILDILEKAGVYNDSISLNAIVPLNLCTSISKMTEAFFILLGAIGKKEIDLKEASTFMARGSGRVKTVTHKLYQITHILEAAGIIERANKVGSVFLSKDIELVSTNKDDPLALDNLLNRPISFGFGKISSVRYNDYIHALSLYECSYKKSEYSDAALYQNSYY